MSNCYSNHRYGANRYAHAVPIILWEYVLITGLDRREHRQQRVRGAG